MHKCFSLNFLKQKLILIVSLVLCTQICFANINANLNINLSHKFNNAGIKINSIDIKANNWIIYDAISKQIINGKNINQKIDIGGFTRLMLIYMLFDEIKNSKLALNTSFKLPQEKQKQILKEVKSSLILNIKQNLVIKDVILSSIINNNLEANLIFEYLLSKNGNVVRNMNLEAERIGLKNTSFNNILGTEQILHYTTAQDLVILLDMLITKHSNQLSLFTQKNFIYNNIKYSNKNQILDIDTLIDTAMLSYSQDNFSMLSSKYRVENNITRQPRRIITLVNGVKNNELAVQNNLTMLNHAFADFDTIKIYDAMHILGEYKLWLGKKDKIKLGIKDSVYLTIPKGFSTRLNIIIDKPKYMYAPIQQGTHIADIKFIYAQNELYSIPVVSLETVHEANFISRWIDKIRLLFD